MTTSTKSISALLSKVPAFLIPAWIGVYWFFATASLDATNLIFRPVLLALALVLLFVWYRLPVTQAEQRLAGVLAVLCTAMLVPSINAADQARSMQEWLKLVIICTISLMLSRALRDADTAVVFGRSLIIASVVSGALIVMTYLRYMGPVLPTYESTRILKGRADVPLNPVAFECVFSFVCGMCLIRSTKLLWFIAIALLVITGTLTGSRAPVAAFFGAGTIMLLVNSVRSRRVLIWFTGWLFTALLLFGIPTAIYVLGYARMSQITEHRWDVWSIALQRFSERPILGYGYWSWYEALASHLPGEHLEGGSFHNEFITALAEQGIVGFVAVLYLYWFLLRSCWKLTFRPSAAWRNTQWILFGCFFLLLRAGVEVPGLFGYSQEPADYLAYIFLAIVISSMSREEDFRRQRRRAAHSSEPRVWARGSRTVVRST